MAWAARKLRVRYEQDDAGDPCWSYVSGYAQQIDMSGPYVEQDDTSEPYVDAWDHIVAPEATWPAWVCECGTHNEGHDVGCVYCGATREDADQL